MLVAPPPSPPPLPLLPATQHLHIALPYPPAIHTSPPSSPFLVPSRRSPKSGSSTGQEGIPGQAKPAVIGRERKGKGRHSIFPRTHQKRRALEIDSTNSTWQSIRAHLLYSFLPYLSLHHTPDAPTRRSSCFPARRLHSSIRGHAEEQTVYSRIHFHRPKPFKSPKKKPYHCFGTHPTTANSLPFLLLQPACTFQNTPLYLLLLGEIASPCPPTYNPPNQ